jgi:acyl-CoA synthetase (AMP-forming)/AMP-acid ligase II
MTPRALADLPSLVALLRGYARERGGERAFVYLGEDNEEQEVLTYGELDRRARVLAAKLLESAEPGDRALLIFPTCLSFVVAFFACLYAGVIAVPTVPPRIKRLRESVLSIARDCRPRLALTIGSYADFTRAQFAEPTGARGLDVIPVDELGYDAVVSDNDSAFVPAEPVPGQTAFLQYTSGSTSLPKGVIVSHANIVSNLEMMRIAFRNDAASTYVGWAPLFHDMGLIANLLEPFYAGALCVLMGPAAFAQRPWLWLQAISRYRARVSGGPNFAYDLCAERAARVLREAPLDLSCWDIAFNSAEPVRAGTLDAFARAFEPVGFRREALFPCYGMADATLLISGGPLLTLPTVKPIGKTALSRDRIEPPADPRDAFEAVACGAALEWEDIRIVDPQALSACEPGRVGEIWLGGPNVAGGYWDNPVASQATFEATLAEAPGRRYLRTGDLGFMDAGQLYVTGRHKDLIVIRGHNYYPQDLELIAEAAYPGLRRGSAAAFTLAGERGEELVLVQEVERVARRDIDQAEAAAAIRRAVFAEFELTVNEVVLVVPATIPKTSSGKIRRAETRRRFLAGELAPLSSPAALVSAVADE